jgi:hypothetical protein
MSSTKRIGVFFAWASLTLTPALAVAQAPAPPPAATAPTPPPAPEPAPAAAPPAPPPPPPAGGLAAQNATPPLATEAMPATREEKLPPITVGAWLRVGARIQGTNPKNLDGERMETAYGELHAGGKIHKNVSLTLNLNAQGLSSGGPSAGIEDAIIGFDFADEVHLWIGQLLVPVDRANYGGPFFAINWNYPGILSVGNVLVITAPKEGPGSYGRDVGGSLWGDIEGGKFNYKLGVFQSGPLSQSPLFSGRLSMSIIGNETGYFGNGTYFGEKDMVTVGLGGQYQKNGSVGPPPVAPAMGAAPTDNYAEVNADILGELKYGGGGWITGDAAYYHFAGDFNAVKDAFYVTGAIATPKIGIGNIQPMVRYQFGSGDGPKVWAVDAFVSYLIMGPALKVMAGFQHTDLGNDTVGNAIQLGAQGIFF